MRSWKLALGLTSVVALAALAREETSIAADDAKARGETAGETPLAALGRRLFHDPTVSRSGRHACASCHDPEHGWSDGRKVSDDNDGPTRRHSQPVTDLGGTGFHWDGEFAAVEDLVIARIGGGSDVRALGKRQRRSREARAAEHGKEVPFDGPSYGGAVVARGAAPLVVPIPDRLGIDARYAPAFQAAFGDPELTSARMVQAVSAFVATLQTSRNALDRRLAGDSAALSQQAARGLALFQGRAGCATCHVLTPGPDGRAPLTDRLYHDTGVAFANPGPGGPPTEFPVGGRKGSSSLGIEQSGIDIGRGAQSFSDAETAAFKTPSLRDVALRGPYMHDGSLATLEAVVQYYSQGGTPNAHLDPAIKELHLSRAETSDLVAFLNSLTGETRAGVLPPRRDEKRVRVTVLDAAGAPLSGLAVSVVPFGERLGGRAPETSTTTTSAEGVAEFVFPQTTHVVLEAGGLELACGRPIPDSTGDLEVLAVPKDRIVVRIRGADLPSRLTATVMASRSPGAPADEQFVFERVRAISGDEAVYQSSVGRTRGVALVQFDRWQPSTFRAAVDLSGGASAPVRVR